MGACGTCLGEAFTEHPDQPGTLVPCKRCRTKAYDKWGQGQYRSTADREEFFEQVRKPA